ncbi:MAG: peptide ABC transporter substrate-binding protein [Chloroflexi bacterium]|nr:peptide ABC transporter substrate-binding protein [Chloroflexota bacterium]
MKRFGWALIALLLVVGTACGAATPGGGAGGEGGTLTIFGDDPPTLDPALMSDTTSAVYVVELFSGLVTLNRQLQIVPDLAESWQISADGKSYTFKLRKGAMFHSGKEVTANDFKYSFERAADPKTNSHTSDTYLGDIKGVKEKLEGKAKEVSGVKVVDDSTLQIDLDAPRFYFLAKMTYPTSFVVDKENVESGRSWTDKPNGTGPFKMKEWKKGEQILLERNASFYMEPAKLNQVKFLLAGGSAMTMYENNEVDVSPVGINDIERIQDTSNPLNREFVVANTLDTWYVGFNVEVPPFDDPKVRQAFNHAVDKSKIVKVVLKDLFQPAKGVIPPGMPGYNPSVKGLDFDPNKAKQLLKESKYGDNLPPITFTIPSSSTTVDPVTEAIVEQWKTNLGITVKIQQVEWATFLVDIKRDPLKSKKNKYQVYELGWSADYPDPQDFVDILFHSKSLDNNGAYSNPKVDELLDKARSESASEQRFRLYQEAEQIIVNDGGWVPLYHGKTYRLVKPKIKDYLSAPMIIPQFKYISVQ